MDLKTLESLTSIEQCDAAAGIVAGRRKQLVADLVEQCEARERAVLEKNIAELAKYNIPYKPTGVTMKPRKATSVSGPACAKCSGTKYYAKSGECVRCKQKAAKPKRA